MSSQDCLAVQLQCFRYLGLFASPKRKTLAKLFLCSQISCYVLNLLLQSFFLVANATNVVGFADDIGNVIRVFNSFVKLSILFLTYDKVAKIMQQINDTSASLKNHRSIQKVKKLEGRVAIIYVRTAILIVTWICLNPVIVSLIHLIKSGDYEFNLPVRSSFFGSESNLTSYLLTYAMVGCISFSTIFAHVRSII